MARVGQAAQRLGLSRRQLERLIQRYKDEGAAGLVSRKRGRPGNRQLASGVADRTSCAPTSARPRVAWCAPI
ncbi:MAG: helix-turn-helix domain-containing protein [Variovorax sp.]